MTVWEPLAIVSLLVNVGGGAVLGLRYALVIDRAERLEQMMLGWKDRALSAADQLTELTRQTLVLTESLRLSQFDDRTKALIRLATSETDSNECRNAAIQACKRLAKQLGPS